MKQNFLIFVVCILLIISAFIFKVFSNSSNNNSVKNNILEVFVKKDFEAYPKQKSNSPVPPLVSAKAYELLYEGNNTSKVLLSFNSDQKLPIASITKLVTVLVAFNSSGYSLANFNQSIINGEGSMGRYSATDTLPVSELIKSMLVESDNDAARAICANESGNFTERMNSFAKYIGANSSYFYNCTGLDYENGGINISTAHDVIAFMRSIKTLHPDFFDTMSLPSSPILNNDKTLHHIAISTYESASEGLPYPVLGGKTGTTDKAKQNLVLAMKVPNGTLYAVVLGSDDRFSDMKKIVDYVHDNFEW